MLEVSADVPSQRTGSLAFRSLAVLLGLAALVPGFGLIDLVTPWIVREGGQVSDVGYGALAGILVGVGFLAQAGSPGRRIAAFQQVALTIPAYAVAGLLGRDRDFLPFTLVLTAAVVLTGALHPARSRILTRGRLRPSLAVLALVAAGPLVLYALEMARNQRLNLPPVDAHDGLNQWAALAAAALALALVAGLASIGTEGFAIPGFCAAAAAVAWGVAAAIYPSNPGAEGRAWALAAIVWGVVFAGLTERERRRGA